MAGSTPEALGPGQALFRVVRFWSRRWTGAGQAIELEHARDVMVTEAVASLNQHAGASVNAVANALGIDQSGASRFIAQAVQRGYLAKATAPEDARQRALYVTPAGEELLHAAHAWQESVFAELTSGWAEDDVRQLQMYLERLLRAQDQES
jgi:MarR family transcriptional regulator, organic hydroperoxide resistance regulator